MHLFGYTNNRPLGDLCTLLIYPAVMICLQYGQNSTNIEFVRQIVASIVPSNTKDFNNFLATLSWGHALIPPSITLWNNGRG